MKRKAAIMIKGWEHDHDYEGLRWYHHSAYQRFDGRTRLTVRHDAGRWYFDIFMPNWSARSHRLYSYSHTAQKAADAALKVLRILSEIR